ncbi:acetyltransferase [Phocaeicola sp.]
MVLYGASGHAKVIIDILESMGIQPEYIVDDNCNIISLLEFEVRRDIGIYDELIISIGYNNIRKLITERLDVNKYLTAIHSSAVISKNAKVDCGSVIMQGAVVQSGADIGRHCIINTCATVDHDCKIGDFVHISPHATLCGNDQIGEGSWIGAAAVVLPGVKIGSWSLIGAGSVVTKDIPDGVLAYGNKCQIIRSR